MNFEMTDDRRMLSDSLTRFLSKQYGIEHRNKVAYAAPFHDPAKWDEMVELGILYALVREDQGGMGGGGFDIACVFEALGQHLCPEPVLANLMALRLLAAAGADLEPVLTGQTRYGVAIGETDAPYDLQDIRCEAKEGRLTGRKSVVYGGYDAERFLVAAKHNGELALFDLAARDAEIAGYGMIDGGNAAEVICDNSPATLLLDRAETAFEAALDAGRLALCAEAIGAMDTAFAACVDYLKTRKQFGKPIASFQALQHRMIDLQIEIEQARSITIRAADALDTPAAPRAIAMAKNLIGRAARLVAEETIQLQGGIGVTWEYPGAHYAKRLVMIDHQLGDTDYHLERVIALAS